ncbi:adenosylmethionine--8-amino-7-oxononanoate transaminase [Aeromicrobium sp. CTD01-1L150]|uniref:adenosylmethionine--8-amino-7-oxononanoate transaminase n=1 Tax=Aeromicrobium sp. CTD01-1L150 TaxID=3341830 RepID=UPI0035C01D15
MPDTVAGAFGLIERDHGLVWHPYAPLDGPRPYAVDSAEGIRLSLTASSGETFEAIDAMSSWWCAVHGYRHRSLDAAAHAQIDMFSHVMFGGLTHAPAVRLAERLTAMAPGPMAHVFFADSGSVSVEVAVKLSLQYQAARRRPGRQRILTVRGGYHGDTFVAMSVCDPVDGMHASFGSILPRQVFAPRPPQARLVEQPGGATTWEVDDHELDVWADVMRASAAEHADEVAAIVVEPILQGAGGMRAYHPDCLRVLREIADEHDLLLVLDEIATGFGRTGRLFAADWADVAPDVLCVGKALTGGYLSLAAVLTTGEVGSLITGSQHRSLLHGPTFMANPLACSVANASLDLVEASWQASVGSISTLLRHHLQAARTIDGVVDVRVLGAVGVVELAEPVDVAVATRTALEHGVWIRPFRNLIYTMPPYVCEPDDVAAIAQAMVHACAACAA